VPALGFRCFRIQQFRISTMEIGQNSPADKPAAQGVRDRLPNRRPAVTIAFERGEAASPLGAALDRITP
jgi:hypothetical protein